jgi:hypothetical protein
MEKARYFDSADQVLLIHPLERFIARIFGKDRIVIKCKDCKRIPTDLYGSYCLDCSIKKTQNEKHNTNNRNN